MPPPAASHGRFASPRDVPPRPLRVLVVEDDPDSLETLLKLCHRLGHTCLTATSRAEALSMLIHQPPDAILLDLMLPGGNGIEVLRVVRAHHFGARVAVVTAADSGMIEEVERLKPDAVFRKPLDFAEVRRWLGA